MSQTLKYPGIVRAARNVGQEKKNLAEQLYLEIPPRGKGRRPAGEATDPERFAEAAAEILAETGEAYTALSLRNYRDVAAWAAAGNSHVHVSIPWADASWTAHVEAYQKGISWAEFSAGKRTKRAVREQAGASTGDVPAASRAINVQPEEAAKLVAGLDDDGKAKLSAELVKSMSPKQRRKLVRDVTIQEGERARAEWEADERKVEHLPIEAVIAGQAFARKQIAEKIREALSLLAQVNSDWSEYEGSVNMLIIGPLITQLRLEIGLLEFSAGIEPPLDHWRPEQ